MGIPEGTIVPLRRNPQAVIVEAVNDGKAD